MLLLGIPIHQAVFFFLRSLTGGRSRGVSFSSSALGPPKVRVTVRVVGFSTHLSNEKNPGCSGCIGDDTTQLYGDFNKPI